MTSTGRLSCTEQRKGGGLVPRYSEATRISTGRGAKDSRASLAGRRIAGRWHPLAGDMAGGGCRDSTAYVLCTRRRMLPQTGRAPRPTNFRSARRSLTRRPSCLVLRRTSAVHSACLPLVYCVLCTVYVHARRILRVHPRPSTYLLRHRRRRLRSQPLPLTFRWTIDAGPPGAVRETPIAIGWFLA